MQRGPLPGEAELSTYKVIQETSPNLLQDRLNGAYEDGYYLAFFSAVPTVGGLTYVAIMELSSGEEEEEQQ